MGIELSEYFERWYQEVEYEAEACGTFREEAFVTLAADILVDAGELQTFDYQPLVGRKGMRIDGSGGDPLESNDVLTLVIADLNQHRAIESLTQTSLNTTFNRARSFVQHCLDEEFRDGLDETAPVFGLADMIAARWKVIDRIRIILVTNRRLSHLVDGREAEEIGGKLVAYNVWDIGRFFEFETSGKGREEIEIDLVDEFGHGFPVLPAHLDSAAYAAYLMVVPGRDLAAIYHRWGARLLEQNVRVFLQARGSVNKGIRNTLQNDPEMFFAYNNGVTATAEEVRCEDTVSGTRVVWLKNLQIVNGGQTTASIHAASRSKDIDLDRVFVQMKLSIVDSARTMEVVPKISEFANTQNRVSAADFFSNHPFHVRIEGISRRLSAPSRDGTFRTSKWFYERARGQYQDERGKLSGAKRKAFDLEFPRSQVITKTDLAKFENVWRLIPHTVSMGAQKNFANFAHFVSAEWDKDAEQFNERTFRHAVAKAILFKEMERIVSKAEWYEGGYRANIVAHGISRLAHEVKSRRRMIDFDGIWQQQVISSALAESLALAAKAAQDVILSPQGGVRNISEWAKKEECWTAVRQHGVVLAPGLDAELVSLEIDDEDRRNARNGQKADDRISAQLQVLQLGAEFWKAVSQWGLQNRQLTDKDMGILKRAIDADRGGRIPSELQSLHLVKLIRRLEQEGCPHSLPRHG